LNRSDKRQKTKKKSCGTKKEKGLTKSAIREHLLTKHFKPGNMLLGVKH
jgi:hypothetical protein